MSGHYQVFHTIKTINDIKNVFPEGEVDELNWCVFSTSGVHGTYATLDEIEQEIADGEDTISDLTVLVIMPRMVKMLYGNIQVNEEDIPYLRKLANSSIESINKSQKGNL